LDADAFDVLGQPLREPRGQHGDAVLATLAVVDHQLPAREVHVLDPQPAALEQPEAGFVHEGAPEGRRAAQATEHRLHLVAREDQRNAHRTLGPGHLFQALDRTPQHVSVEERQRTEGLVLRGGADVGTDRQVGEVAPDLGQAHLSGMTPSCAETKRRIQPRYAFSVRGL